MEIVIVVIVGVACVWYHFCLGEWHIKIRRRPTKYFDVYIYQAIPQCRHQHPGASSTTLNVLPHLGGLEWLIVRQREKIQI